MSKFDFHVPVMSLVNARHEPIVPLIEANLAWLKANGAQGLVVMGTTGEFPNFSVAQRERYLEALLSVNPDLPVMVNIGAASMVDALALQAHALSQPGVTSIIWMPPFYYPDTAINGLTRCLDRLLDHQPEHRPFYLYHYPKLSQVSIGADLLENYPRVAGLKDTSGDFDRIGQLVKDFPDKQIFVGTDYRVSEAHALGCAGAISAMGNIVPHLIARACQGETTYDATLLKLRQTFETFGKLAGFKAYLNHLKLAPHQASMTLPFVDLSLEQTSDMLSVIEMVLQEGPAPHALC